MRTVPNQKIITVHKEPCDKQHYYAAINLDALRDASADLTAGAFRLWIYYASN